MQEKKEISEDNLLERFRSQEIKTREIFVLSGDVRSGKTTKLWDLARRIADMGMRVGGVFQPEEDGTYFVQDVQTGERKWIAKRSDFVQKEGMSFVFNDEAFKWAADVIRRARLTCDVLIVDEIGRLEERGAGHMPALDAVLENERTSLYLLAVRQDVFARIRFNFSDVISFVRVNRFDKHV